MDDGRWLVFAVCNADSELVDADDLESLGKTIGDRLPQEVQEYLRGRRLVW